MTTSSSGGNMLCCVAGIFLIGVLKNSYAKIQTDLK